MKKASIAVLLFCCSGVSVAAVPDGKIEKPFTFNNEVVCLKEIQEQMTPYLKSFEEEGEVKYKYNVKSGLSYKDTIGLRLQINRVDSGLGGSRRAFGRIPVADIPKKELVIIRHTANIFAYFFPKV